MALLQLVLKNLCLARVKREHSVFQKDGGAVWLLGHVSVDQLPCASACLSGGIVHVQLPTGVQGDEVGVE